MRPLRHWKAVAGLLGRRGPAQRPGARRLVKNHLVGRLSDTRDENEGEAIFLTKMLYGAEVNGEMS